MSTKSYAHLPRPVRLQAEKADAELERPPNPTPTPPPATPPANDAPPAPNGEGGDAPPEPQDGDLETPPAPPAAAPTLEQQFAELKSSYDVLKGKYDAEVPRLAGQLRTVLSQNEQLTTSLAAARSPQPGPAAAAPAAAPAIDADDILAGLSDAERDELGPGALKTVAKLIQLAVPKAAAAAVKPVAERTEADRQERIRDRTEQFWSEFSELVPDFAAIEAMPEFGAFMRQVERYSGWTFQALCEDALAKLDAQRCAGFYDAFKAQAGITPPAAATPPVPPAPAAPTPKPPAARVVPGSGAPRSPAPTPPAKRTFKESDIKAAYRDRSLGKYRGREGEFAALETEIMAAQREGRVTPG